MGVKFYFYGLLAASIAAACNGNGKETVTETDTAIQQQPVRDGTYLEDSTTIPVDTAEKIITTPAAKTDAIEEDVPVVKKIENPQGIFQTTLPCFDCKGIEHTVAFYPDLSYRLEDVKFDKEKETTKASGHFRSTGNTIWLYKDQIVQARYTWKGDTLMYMESKTNKLIPLQKLTSATENTVWMNKKKEGIDFYGVGNEPFWNVEIDNEKQILFHLAEWTEPKHFTPSEPEFSADSIFYNTSSDSAQLKITIYNTFCRDGMSDYIYTQAVKVVHNNQTYSGCGILF